MIEQLKMDLKLRGKSILGRQLLPLLFFVLGFAMVCLILAGNEDTTFFCMGTLIAFFMLVIAGLIWGLFFPQEYMLAMSMGRTRKAFLFSYAVRSLLNQGIGYLMVLAMYVLELAVYPLLFPGYENETLFPFLTYWWVIVLAVPGVVLVQMFLGVMIGKFGKPFLLAAYFAWIGLCILGPQAFHADDGATLGGQLIHTVFGWGSIIPSPVWIVIGIGLVAAMAGTIVVEGRRLMVK